MDIRCGAKKFGELEDGVLEIKCSSKFCGAATGIVILHRFDALTGELLETKRFRDPISQREVQCDPTDIVAVRSSRS